MIITCPNCAAKFMLLDGALGLTGKKVRCGVCSTLWHQSPQVSHTTPEYTISNELEFTGVEDIPQAVKPLEETAANSFAFNEKILLKGDYSVKKKSLLGYASACAVFLCIMALCVFLRNSVVQIWPGAGAIYALAGIDLSVPGQGLVFEKITADSDTKTGALSVQGYIINLTSKRQYVSLIEASAISVDGKALKVWYIEPPEKTLEKESKMPFKAIYNTAIPDAHTVNLRFILFAKKDLKDAENTQAALEAADAPKPADESL